MTSLSTVSVGVKPATTLLDGSIGFGNAAWSYLPRFTGGLTYNYLAASGVDTALNITGSGVITWLGFGSGAASTSANMTVTIDGVEVLNDDRTDIATEGIVPIGTIAWLVSSTSTSSGHVPFNSSLVVTLECDVNAYLTYNYYST